FPPGRSGGSWLNGGLEARISRADPARATLAAGHPLVVSLHLRNGLGVARDVPTEFLRPDGDGKPALRRGVSLVLSKLPKTANELESHFGPAPERKPARTNHFDPGDARRSLAPTESFEAISIPALTGSN